MASGKRISVRVVDWPRHDEMVGSLPQTVSMDAAGGVEVAVQTAYPAFPGSCQEVRLVTPASVPLWVNGAWLFSHEDMYDAISEGYVVEVHLNGMRPTGPDAAGRPGWVPDGAAPPGADRLPGPGRGDGPLGARLVRELLSRLEGHM